MAWDGLTVPERRAEAVCRAHCPGDRECACRCHDEGDRIADRVRALLKERFGDLVA